MGFAICVATVLYAAAAIILIINKIDSASRLTATVAGSALFVGLGLLCAFVPASNGLYYSMTMVAGLVMALVSNIAFALRDILIDKRDSCVMIEYIFAMLSQMFYITLLSCFAALSWISILAGLLFFTAALFLTKRLNLTADMGVKTALIRMGIVSLLVGLAADALVQEACLRGCVLLAGSVLLYISNGLRCLFEMIEISVKWRRAVMPACYYAAQMLFALSILLR